MNEGMNEFIFPSILFSKKNIAAHFNQLLINDLPIFKKLVTKLELFKFPSQPCKLHLLNLIGLEAI